jgi:hypothetical protein
MNALLSMTRSFRLRAAVLLAVLVIALLHHADLAVGDSYSFQPGYGGETEQWLVEGPAIETLAPQVQVRRAGRILTLDFQLVDAQGRPHRPDPQRRSTPPTFAVYKAGQPIGTGSFEYG